ncbi:MAG: PAC2 family protein [Actinomycetia bacterium]|nr:PAC2 family protein [Actinomycetes bacterium]
MPEADLRNLRRPIAVLAFAGWSDAAQAASDAVDHLVSTYPSSVAVTLDPSDYYDFQATRPMTAINAEGQRTITWPSTEVLVCRLPERDVVVVRGPEPSFRWPAYAAVLVAALLVAEPELVIALGALLSENPHTRPIPVSLSSTDPGVRSRYDAEQSTYEGPTGIQGVVAQACQMAGLPTVSLWAACSHYVANPPNPKATLALLARLEDLLGQPINLGDLPARAELWEKNVNELADEDPDVAEYIHSLEVASDARQVEPSGDAIAAEFQRYLRRQGES